MGNCLSKRVLEVGEWESGRVGRIVIPPTFLTALPSLLSTTKTNDQTGGLYIKRTSLYSSPKDCEFSKVG